NPRPSGPKPDALPSCAIHRLFLAFSLSRVGPSGPAIPKSRRCATKPRYSPKISRLCLKTDAYNTVSDGRRK
ncbi:hypothetical protein, partial [Vibrio nigripulchritudo]|uniref:hypothetical protein n=1 Tax=Vibrio nigripulchritudo TaxID=28173 RepID=UPI001E2A6AA3